MTSKRFGRRRLRQRRCECDDRTIPAHNLGRLCLNRYSDADTECAVAGFAAVDRDRLTVLAYKVLEFCCERRSGWRIHDHVQASIERVEDCRRRRKQDPRVRNVHLARGCGTRDRCNAGCILIVVHGCIWGCLHLRACNRIHAASNGISLWQRCLQCNGDSDFDRTAVGGGRSGGVS